MSHIAGYHCPWKSETIVRYRVWHARMDLGWHTWLNDMSVGCHHHLWTTYMVARNHACYEIIAIQNTSGRMTSRVTCHLSLGLHTQWDDFGVVCHHRTWTTYTVGEHLVRHDIMALVQNTWSNDVGRGGHHRP
ncbi:hypothetical protein EJD97_007965 [Solanum chilense]|uniref:Uncharacterized protein n=1 Tax=Solanum chilense TaxID=4083 RepID=A0A6N2AJZ9_SOLCI|nr:hypothetical protein EJD97_007965 [Solanum chilense]